MLRIKPVVVSSLVTEQCQVEHSDVCELRNFPAIFTQVCWYFYSVKDLSTDHCKLRVLRVFSKILYEICIED